MRCDLYLYGDSQRVMKSYYYLQLCSHDTFRHGFLCVSVTSARTDIDN